MKKQLTLFALFIIATFTTLNAQNNSQNVSEEKTPNLTELIERLDAAGVSLGEEPANLFTQEEQIVLKEYLLATNESNDKNMTDTDGLAYAVQIYGGCDKRGFGTFSISAPGNFNVINPTNKIYYAGDQDGSGRLFGFVVEGSDNHRCTLVEIDTETGVETEIGEMDIFQTKSQLPTGISWNSTNNTMYAIASSSGATELYTINLETAELTSIGFTGTELGIWLAINSSGNAYMLDIGMQAIYSLDLETAASTYIGPVGVTLRFGQDGDFDPATGILYTVGYQGSGINKLYSVNLQTGAYTSHGTVNNNCAQMGLFSITGSAVNVPSIQNSRFSVYPNPVNDYFTFESSEYIHEINIYNLTGQKLIQSITDDTQGSIDVSKLCKGVYFIETVVNGRKETYKFIKN